MKNIIRGYENSVKPVVPPARAYFNKSEIQVPVGACIAIISSDGLEFEHSFDMEKGGVEKFDVSLWLDNNVEKINPLEQDSIMKTD